MPLKVVIRPISGDDKNSPNKLVIAATKYETEVSIQTIFDQSNFDLIGKYTDTIYVPVNEEKSKPMVFNIEPKKEGLQDIKLEFFQQGQFLNELKIGSLVENAQKIGEDMVRRVKKIPKPDIMLYINRKDDSDREYEILFFSEEYDFYSIGSIGLSQNPDLKFQAIFEEIENIEKDSENYINTIKDALEAKGQNLYEELFMSTELKNLYWNFRDNVKTILLYS